jgi:HSP20 family protein
MSGMLSTNPRGLSPVPRRSVLPFREMEDWMERLWGENGNGWSGLTLSPPLDMSETADAINLQLDLPGVEAKEIDIQVTRNHLTISGERKTEKEESGRTFHRLERTLGQFSRSVMLPCEVQEDKVEAKYHDGVLRVTLPKSSTSKSRLIKVKT